MNVHHNECILIHLGMLKSLMCHELEPLPAAFRLDKLPAHRGANVYRQASVHTLIHTQGQFTVTNSPVPQMHLFGLWKEAGVTAEKPCRHRDNMPTTCFQCGTALSKATGLTLRHCCYLMYHICHINSVVNWCATLTVTVSQGQCWAPKSQDLGCGFLNRPSIVWMFLLPLSKLCVPFQGLLLFNKWLRVVHRGTQNSQSVVMWEMRYGHIKCRTTL